MCACCDSVKTKDMGKNAKKGVKGVGKGMDAAEDAAGVVEGVAQLSGAGDVSDIAGQVGDVADMGGDAADIAKAGVGCFQFLSKKKKSTKVDHSDEKTEDKAEKKESGNTEPPN